MSEIMSAPPPPLSPPPIDIPADDRPEPKGPTLFGKFMEVYAKANEGYVSPFKKEDKDDKNTPGGKEFEKDVLEILRSIPDLKIYQHEKLDKEEKIDCFMEFPDGNVLAVDSTLLKDPEGQSWKGLEKSDKQSSETSEKIQTLREKMSIIIPKPPFSVRTLLDSVDKELSDKIPPILHIVHQGDEKPLQFGMPEAVGKLLEQLKSALKVKAESQEGLVAVVHHSERLIFAAREKNVENLTGLKMEDKDGYGSMDQLKISNAVAKFDRILPWYKTQTVDGIKKYYTEWNQRIDAIKELLFPTK